MLTYLLFSFFLFSFSVLAQNFDSSFVSSVGISTRVGSLKFYKCNYSDTASYYKVLSSGSETETTETWAINKKLLDSLPALSEMKLNLEEVAANAKLYLENRYYSPHSNKTYILTEITFNRILYKEEESKNWVIIAKFMHDKRGFYQYVPILLDGRIILSSNE